jgi:cytochrome P450
MSVTKDPSAVVPLRPGFDHQTNPDLLSGSFGGRSADEDPDFAKRAAAALEIVADIAAAVTARRTDPRDDMISLLVRSTVDDRLLTDDELYQLGFLLYRAGLDTVANVLTYSFRYLAGNAGLRHLLRDEPDRIPDAVEEFLRLFSIASTVRVVTRDAEVAGCPMKAGDRVVLPTASAGRDQNQYPDGSRTTSLPTANRSRSTSARWPGLLPCRCAGPSALR